MKDQYSQNKMSPFRFRKFGKALGYAISGISYCFKTQFNFLHQLWFVLGLGALNIYLKFNFTEWCWFIAGHILIAAMEIMNTAIEGLCEMHTTEYDERIKVIKDSAAGAVLMTIAFTAVYYLGIAVPKIIALINI